FAFAVVVLGGLGYTAGVVWGGLTLGVAQALTETYLEAGLSLLVAFVLLYVILRFMPAGIMGKGRLEGASRARRSSSCLPRSCSCRSGSVPIRFASRPSSSCGRRWPEAGTCLPATRARSI